MTPGERLRKAREAEGLTREEMAARLEGFTANRIYDMELGRTKITEAVALKLCVPFGWSTRWLLEGTGERVMDRQHINNLKSQIFERGILSPEEWKMIEMIRNSGIKSASELEAYLDEEQLADRIASAVREKGGRYASSRKKKSS